MVDPAAAVEVGCAAEAAAFAAVAATFTFRRAAEADFTEVNSAGVEAVTSCTAAVAQAFKGAAESRYITMVPT